MKTQEFSTEIGGKKITATFSNLANQANGSVMIKVGETIVLATVVMGKDDKRDIGYFPLTVDYEEKFYAAGLLLGGRFMKREGRPSEDAILAGRVIDRTIRPLFNQSIRREIQVVITVLSIDKENGPDILSIIATSLALATSDIQWDGPVGTVRIGLSKDGAVIINPTYIERESNLLNMIICGKEGKINMIEAEGKEVSEQKIDLVFKEAIKQITKLEKFQKDIIKKIGKDKLKIEILEISNTVKTFFEKHIGEKKLIENLFSNPDSKKVISGIQNKLLDKITEDELELNKEQLFAYIDHLVDKIIHSEALENNRRVDGRSFDTVREIFTQAGGVSENLHGVGLFFRGGTHVMSVLTLGGPQDSQYIEGMETRTRKYFMHHYNFPSFSVGETGRVGGINRRSVGHGSLAEKALRAIIPSHDIFPYTIRLVSESMASNGSTSMGSVCASTLALADGGVPIKNYVAGIAIGLVIKDDSYKILTDIQGPEDHHGDMDFKIAGTKDGITAMQMDVKVDGILPKILFEALEAAKKARYHILGYIEKEIPNHRKNVKLSAPIIEKVFIEEDKIGLVIGPSGKTIKKLSENTNTVIEINDDGVAYISGKKDGVDAAREYIRGLIRVYKVGDKAQGKVVKILDFGAIVEIGPNQEGLVHISELAPYRVEKVTDVVCHGETIPVTVSEVDNRGRLKFSIVKDNPNFAKMRGKKDCKEFTDK